MAERPLQGGDEFSYADSNHPAPQPEVGKQWWHELERLGVEVVRTRLAQIPAPSSHPMRIGAFLEMKRGFAEEWLAWKSERQAAAEEARQERMVKATESAAKATESAAKAAYGAAIAAGLAAVGTFIQVGIALLTN
jgi:hypothetical protein